MQDFILKENQLPKRGSCKGELFTKPKHSWHENKLQSYFKTVTESKLTIYGETLRYKR